MSKSFFFLLIILVSCTVFVPESVDLREKIDIKKELTCNNENDFQLYSSQDVINENFYTFAKNPKNPLNKTSLISAWMLLQMNYRPDLTSVNSQFLTSIIKDGKTYVYDSYSEEHNFLNFIKFFNKQFNGSHSLSQIAKVISDYHPKDFKISEEFSFYLNQHLSEIKKSKILSSFFLRGTEYLRENERLKPLNYSLVVGEAKQVNFKETKMDKKEDLICNVSQFKTIKESSVSNSFSINLKDFVVLVSTSQNTKFSPGKYTFFESKMSKYPKTLCYFKNKISAWLISDFGRSPYQHLDHLLQYKIRESLDKEELSEYLSFSRHLILKNPIRLIYESDRGTKEQLDKLLKFDIPVYYSAKLGNVFGMVEDKKSYLFKDNRDNSEIKCSN